jgi:hypothetical protein
MVPPILSQEQMTKFAMETANIPMTHEGSYTETTNEDNAHYFL